MKYYSTNRGMADHGVLALLYATLAITPFAYWGEVSALISGGADSALTISSSKYMVIFKNMIVPLMIVFSFINWMHNDRNKKGKYIFLLLIAILCPLLLSQHSNTLLFIAGIRWIAPLFLLILLVGVITKRELYYATIGVCIIFFLQISMQIYETIYAPHWYGTIIGTTLSSRAPGLFSNPNTASIFSCLSFIMVYRFLGLENPLSKVVLILAPLSVFITLSGTGLLAMMVMLISVLLRDKWRILFPLTLIVSVLIVQTVIPVLRGGDSYIDSSVMARGAMFMNAATGGEEPESESDSDSLKGFNIKTYINEEIMTISVPEWFLATDVSKLMGVTEEKIALSPLLFGQGFGAGTNGCALIAHNFSTKLPCIVSDALYTQLLINIGWMGAAIIIFPFVMMLFYAFIFNNKAMFFVLLLAAISALNNTMLEAFPMNVLVPVLLAFWLHEKNKKTSCG